MLRIELDGELEARLRTQAARLRKSPEDCVRAAVAAWTADCEESFRNACQLAQGENFVRTPDDGFMD